MSELPNICKGCRNYEIVHNVSGVWCTVQRYGLADECPCHECLIKSMCSELCDASRKLIGMTMQGKKELYNGTL